MNLALITDFNEKGITPGFSSAEPWWTCDYAITKAEDDGIDLLEEHWDVINALQIYFSQHKDKKISLRQLHDALDERFHQKGGLKYLYTLFPKGPINQAGAIAGLTPPAGAINTSFGSVM